MSVRDVIVIASTLVVLAGCSVHSRGDPKPANSSPTVTGESTDPRFADLLPPRPRELDLTGVDPCADLLTDQQLRELDYDRGYARPPAPSTSAIHGGPNCTFGSSGLSGGDSRNIGSLVGISVTEGALSWITDRTRTPDQRPDVVTVNGFFALVLPHPMLPDNCKVVVDTAKNQYLEVASSPDSGEDTTFDPYCAEAERVAGMALQTISASR